MLVSGTCLLTLLLATLVGSAYHSYGHVDADADDGDDAVMTMVLLMLMMNMMMI